MAGEAKTRRSTFMTLTGGAIAIIVVAAGWDWLNNMNDAIDRDEKRNDRAREVVYDAIYTTKGLRGWYIDWGRRGALKREMKPSSPFERYTTALLGDQLYLRVNTGRDDDRNMTCSITVDGEAVVGRATDTGCEASVTVR